MLNIVVLPRKEKVITIEGQIMSVYETLISKDGKICRLRDCTDLSDVENIEIAIVRWFWPFNFLYLDLTPEIKKGIVYFLQRFHAKQDLSFNCYCFTNLIYGINDGDNAERMYEFWKKQPHRLRRQVGDVAFLVDHKERMFYHSAVYIGRGLYLSVYGNGGDLEISTLKDMKRECGAKEVVFVVPRKEAVT